MLKIYFKIELTLEIGIDFSLAYTVEKHPNQNSYKEINIKCRNFKAILYKQIMRVFVFSQEN